ncbi:hypothetical protein HMPREF9946_02347 [Acetobacteraceae bacterium AT-5844]|nr:hypothetical protein HMPREF9946_02347 [Acetobacteraceae bacterium AT-5844]
MDNRRAWGELDAFMPEPLPRRQPDRVRHRRSAFLCASAPPEGSLP